MKTIIYFFTTLIQFFKSSKKIIIVNPEYSNNNEFTYSRYGIYLPETEDPKNTSKSLVSEMYSEENEILFI